MEAVAVEAVEARRTDPSIVRAQTWTSRRSYGDNKRRGSRKWTKIRAALSARAVARAEEDATALDYVCSWVAEGQTLQRLAQEIAQEIGESCSRTFLSHVAHRLAPDATERIAAARRSGADALVERALELADAPCTAADATQRKLQVDTLLWQAARLNAARYGTQPRRG